MPFDIELSPPEAAVALEQKLGLMGAYEHASDCLVECAYARQPATMRYWDEVTRLLSLCLIRNK